MFLQSIWFFIWGLLWAIFFATDGFDFGVGTLYPFLGKTEHDKRVMINAIGPLWDGNEVWLITAGGVTFAAFPQVYAVMFSTLYTPLMIILFALILRGVAFEFRGKVDCPRWLKIWDAAIFIGSVLPALLFGVAFGNIFMGIPFDAQGLNHGGLLDLINPYGLLTGLLFLLLFIQHGALWLAVRSGSALHDRVVTVVRTNWFVLLIVAVLFFVATYFVTDLYDNYIAQPVLWVIPGLVVLSLFGVRLFLRQKKYLWAWVASAVTIVGATFFGITGLFPRLFPSSIDSQFDLTAFNASSSQDTLTIMLVVVAVFIPIVIAYQVWAYRLFSHKIDHDNFERVVVY